MFPVKKIVIVLLVLVALLLLLLPGAVGMMAERQYRALMVQSQELTPGLRYVVEDYQRGWFRSSARYRLEIEPALLLPEEEPQDLPPSFALFSEADIHHGPVFLTALSAEGGQIGPGLALSLDRLSLRGPEGAVTALPGHISTRLGIFSRNRSDILLHAVDGTLGREDTLLSWQGMQGKVRFDNALSDLSSDLVIGGFELSAPTWQVAMGEMHIDGRHQLTEFGFWAGAGSAEIAPLSMTAPAVGKLVLGPLSAEADVRVTRTTGSGQPAVTIDLEESFEAVHVGEWLGGPLRFSIVIEDLDAAALGEISAAVQELDSPAHAEDASPAMLLDHMQALLVHGPRLMLREFHFGTPDGALLMTADFAFPPTGPGELGALLAGLEASMNIRVPTAVVDRLKALNPDLGPQLDGLLGTGLLAQDAQFLVMDAALKGGLLTINGQPMPLPLGF